MNPPDFTLNIRSSARKLVRQFGFFKTKYADTGASYSETHALVELDRLKILEVGELGRLLNVDKSQASKLLSGLEKKKWVKSLSISDARKKVYQLTTEGRKVFKRVDLIAHRRVENAMKCLNPNEVEIVAQGLEKFSQALEKSAALENYHISQCTVKHNQQIASIVRQSLKHFGFAGPGTAAVDPSLDYLSHYNSDRQCYYVAEKNSKVYGGAGIAKMLGEKGDVCELIRMFLHPEARNTGLAQILMEECLNFAKNSGYKICYLETTEEMQAAQRLYLKNGFRYVKKRRGNTGHYACKILMEKNL